VNRAKRLRRLAIAVVALGAVVFAGVAAVNAFVNRHRHGADVEHFTIQSKAVHKKVRETAVIPNGTDGKGRPLLVFLHGRGGDEDSDLTDAMFAGLHALGGRAPVVVFPDGGFDRYWHNRRGGNWGSYVLSEVIPEAQRRFKTDPRRVALGGISMGGFGAYDLARFSKRRFCAVGGHSPALWQTGGETAAGAFDDANDFARHNVIGAARSHPRTFARQPLWLDAGTADPFDPGDKAFVAALRSARVPIHVSRTPGGHTGSYWNRHWKQYLAWYGEKLQHC
jgi:S-formylglutathione hydrolase FrmB